MPRYRIVLRNGASRSVIDWLRVLLPVLRRVPADLRVKVEIERVEPPGEDDPS